MLRAPYCITKPHPIFFQVEFYFSKTFAIILCQLLTTVAMQSFAEEEACPIVCSNLCTHSNNSIRPGVLLTDCSTYLRTCVRLRYMHCSSFVVEYASSVLHRLRKKHKVLFWAKYCIRSISVPEFVNLFNSELRAAILEDCMLCALTELDNPILHYTRMLLYY